MKRVKENASFHVMLRYELARVIREAILSGEYQPGDRIPEEEISQKLGVSRTPVREAIVILQQENLLEIRPRYGVFVRTFSNEELIDLLRVTSVTHGLSAYLAAQRITDRQLSSLRKVLAEYNQVSDPDWKLFRNMDRKFHSIIIKVANSPILTGIWENQNSQIILSRFYPLTFPERAKRSLAEHREIAECLARRDPESAEKLMRKHIDSALHDLTEKLASQPSSSLPEEGKARRKRSRNNPLR